MFVSFVCEHKFYGAETLLAVFTFVFKHAVNLKISLSCKNIFSLFIFSYLLCCCYYYAQLVFFVVEKYYSRVIFTKNILKKTFYKRRIYYIITRSFFFMKNQIKSFNAIEIYSEGEPFEDIYPDNTWDSDDDVSLT